MITTIEFLPEAARELEAAHEWYELRRNGLGAEFRLAVDAVVSRARRLPRSYPLIARRTRKALLRRFPYMVLYFVDGERLIVLAVHHGHRDPKAWSDRVRERASTRVGLRTV